MAAASAGRSVMVQGRIVWVSGDLFKGRPKVDQNTRLPKHNAQGQPITEYGFGLAVPKSVLGQTGENQPGQIWAAIHEEAFTMYPSRQIPPNFAMKFKDGDGIDHQGLSYSLREGHANHLIFACTTTIPIKFYKYENGQNFLINEGIKCGDYVNVHLSIKAHPPFGAGKAGLYLNPNAVQLLGYGKEIINAPSGDQIFGGQMPALPPGASATPTVPSGTFPGAPQAQGAPMPPAAPAGPPAPHYGVLPGQFQPPAGGQPMPQASYPPQPPAPPQAQPGMAYPPTVPAPGAYPSNPGMPGVPGYPQPQ